ncbi:MAG: CDP-diacylglycerol--serine O-phosphatidyltransferase [Methylococcaceae bacterium]|nr:MAG: CDP-diacylglycerol--serine O-phosphatidyltransferase [Methylococcaceae bacterium]
MVETNTPIRKRRRGIYLLPNLLTTAALFSGFYAITAAINGRFELAVVAIFAAMVFDGLDGRVARMTNTQSEFGAQYDSMSDLLSFGVAPALVMFVWSLSALGKLGWVAAFVHCAGAALRLARFNTQVGTADKRYFQGLPSPAAAAILAGYIWVGVEYNFVGSSVAMVSLVLTVFSGLLMVSNVRYHSFKEVDMKGKVPFVVVIAVMLGFAVVLAQPPLMLFLIFLSYAVSGPALTLVILRKRRQERKT